MKNQSLGTCKLISAHQGNPYALKQGQPVPPGEELRKIIKDLEKIAHEERTRRQEAQQKLKNFQIRSIKKQKEFFRLMDMVRGQEQKNQATGDNIQLLFQQILSNFQSTNLEINSYFQKKYENLNAAMERNIQRILSTVETQVGRTISISQASTVSIRNAVRQTMAEAREVENDNLAFCKSRDKVEGEKRILVEEKNMLIQELLQNKRKMAKQAKNIKILKHVPSDSVAQNSGTHSPAHKPTSMDDPKLFDSHRASDLHTINLSSIFKRAKDGRKDHLNQKNSLVDPSQNDCVVPERSNPSQTDYTLRGRNRPCNIVNPERMHKRAKSQFVSPQPNNSSLSRKQTLDKETAMTVQSKGTGLVCPFCRRQFQSEMVEGMERTINNLQRTSRRERERAKKLGDSAAQMARKHHQINQALAQIIEETERTPKQEKLEALVKSERLFKTLQVLKKRLEMLETPSVNCGWISTVEEV